MGKSAEKIPDIDKIRVQFPSAIEIELKEQFIDRSKIDEIRENKWKRYKLRFRTELLKTKD